MNSVPSWINEEFFIKVLENFEKCSNVKLLEFTFLPNLAAGEHLGSSMYRVKLEYQTRDMKQSKSLSIVIKIPPVSSDNIDFVTNTPIFAIEQAMYKGPIEDIKSLLESIGDDTKIAPKIIYLETKPRFVIVMEDLGVYGFEKITQPLDDFEDTKMVFEKLAKFHASSFYLINEKGADYTNFNFSVFNAESSMIRDVFLTQSINTFLEVLESWGGYEELIEKVKIFSETLVERGVKLYEPDSDGFNVLNHADFHIKNLLFKKNDNGKIEDFIMLDFQISVLAPPCVDLFYALFNEVSDENRQTRRNEIIAIYHKAFSDTLKRFGYIKKVPSLLDLHMKLLSQGWFEVLKAICFRIFFHAEDANVQVNEIIGTPNSKENLKKIYNSEGYKKFFHSEFPRFIELGFL